MTTTDDAVAPLMGAMELAVVAAQEDLTARRSWVIWSPLYECAREQDAKSRALGERAAESLALAKKLNQQVIDISERAARAEQELADMQDQAWHIANESLRTLEAAEMASKLANPEGKAALFAHWDAGDLCRKFLASHDARAAAATDT